MEQKAKEESTLLEAISDDNDQPKEHFKSKVQPESAFFLKRTDAFDRFVHYYKVKDSRIIHINSTYPLINIIGRLPTSQPGTYESVTAEEFNEARNEVLRAMDII